MPKLLHVPKVDRKVQTRVVLFLQQGNTIDTACRCAGIHRDTYYDWFKRARKGGRGNEAYVEFAEACEMAMSQAEALHIAVIRAAMKDQWQAAAWMLERRNPKDWGRKDRTELTGRDGGPVQHVDVTGMSDEELQKLVSGGESPDPEIGGR